MILLVGNAGLINPRVLWEEKPFNLVYLNLGARGQPDFWHHIP